MSESARETVARWLEEFEAVLEDLPEEHGPPAVEHEAMLERADELLSLIQAPQGWLDRYLADPANRAAFEKAYATLATEQRDLSHPETFCQRCGRPNVVWFAPSPLWNKAVPDGGILCPVCFIEAAEAAGIHASAWCVSPETLRSGATEPSPAAPELLQERYWCGCVREARWIRCSRHTSLDHDEEPPTQDDIRGPYRLSSPASAPEEE
jgi:hypothetical protein